MFERTKKSPWKVLENVPQKSLKKVCHYLWEPCTWHVCSLWQDLFSGTSRDLDGDLWPQGQICCRAGEHNSLNLLVVSMQHVVCCLHAVCCSSSPCSMLFVVFMQCIVCCHARCCRGDYAAVPLLAMIACICSVLQHIVKTRETKLLS